MHTSSIGDITCLVFPSDKYLVSTSADGTICLFRTKDWSLLRRFKGHKVSSFTVLEDMLLADYCCLCRPESTMSPFTQKAE
jgi:WD40 repeat protein